MKIVLFHLHDFQVPDKENYIHFWVIADLLKKKKKSCTYSVTEKQQTLEMSEYKLLQVNIKLEVPNSLNLSMLLKHVRDSLPYSESKLPSMVSLYFIGNFCSPDEFDHTNSLNILYSLALHILNFFKQHILVLPQLNGSIITCIFTISTLFTSRRLIRRHTD